jgi:hypothetical protein
MYEILEGFPDNVLAIKSSGQITHEDYADVLIPLAEEKFEAHGKIKILFVLDDFDGADLRAMWDDTAFGLKHWTGFTHMAIVTDISWAQSMAAIFAPLIPAEVRVFNGAELPAATDWIVGA